MPKACVVVCSGLSTARQGPPCLAVLLARNSALCRQQKPSPTLAVQSSSVSRRSFRAVAGRGRARLAFLVDKLLAFYCNSLSSLQPELGHRPTLSDTLPTNQVSQTQTRSAWSRPLARGQGGLCWKIDHPQFASDTFFHILLPFCNSAQQSNTFEGPNSTRLETHCHRNPSTRTASVPQSLPFFPLII